MEGGSDGKRESEQTEEEVHLWVESENCGWGEGGLSFRPTGKLALNRDRKAFSFYITTFDIRALVGGEKGGLTIRLTGKLVKRP